MTRQPWWAGPILLFAMLPPLIAFLTVAAFAVKGVALVVGSSLGLLAVARGLDHLSRHGRAAARTWAERALWWGVLGIVIAAEVVHALAR